MSSYTNTQGGDYAEGHIDKRTGTFVGRDYYHLTQRDPPPPAFQVPSHAIPLVGRAAALDELRTLLTADAPVVLAPAIAGMGGVGKTVLATAFAHANQAAFPGGIFWLNMEYPDQIAGQVAACAGPGGLDLPDFLQLSFEERIARVQAAWNSPLRRLLVLDNLEDPTLLTRWQPTGSGTRVLITTRRDDWPRHIQCLRLPVLPRPQSIELLLAARANDQGRSVSQLLDTVAEEHAAAAICDLLGDLPLALAIAAALLRLHPSLRLTEFQAQIMADPLFVATGETPTMQAVLREAGLPSGRERGIAATFAISYQQLQPAEALDAQALQVLHAAAYCAATAIPQEALWPVAQLDPSSGAGRTTGDAITRRLRSLGMISSENPGSLSLHRLLAAFVRQQPHSPAILNTTAESLTTYTRALRDQGQIKHSRELVPHIESLLDYQTNLLSAEHPYTLYTAHNLAITLQAQGEYAAARVLFEDVLDSMTQLLGSKHPHTLYTANNLAITLQAQGEYAAARVLFEDVLAARTRLLGAEHPATLSTADNLASTLHAQGEYAAARVYFEDVLAARTRLLGAEHPDTLHTAHNLASTLSSQGEYAAARERYEDVLAARTRLLGAEHPDTLYTAHNLAITLECLGQWRKASELRRDVVAHSEQQGWVDLRSIQYLMALAGNMNARGYLYAARRMLKTRLHQLPPSIWRSSVQFSLFFYRARAVLTALVLGWVATGLRGYTELGLLIPVIVVASAVLSYWSRWALILLFTLAALALSAPLWYALPPPWAWLYGGIAALVGAGWVPYSAPIIAWLLSVSRVRLLFHSYQRRLEGWSKRMLAQQQASGEL